MKNLLAQLDVETFILDVECQRLDKPLEGVKRQVFNNGSLEIEMDKSQGLNGVFHQLTQQGITVLSMRNKANRLEELFVKIVQDEAS